MATYKIDTWNPEKGFGFVRVDGKKVFVHAKNVKPRPPVGADLKGHTVDEVKVDWKAPKGPAVTSAFDLTTDDELRQREEAEKKEREKRWSSLLETADGIGQQLRRFREPFVAALTEAVRILSSKEGDPLNRDIWDEWFLEVQLGEGMREMIPSTIKVESGNLSIGVWYVRVQSRKLCNHMPLYGRLWEAKAHYANGLSITDNRGKIADQLATKRRERLSEDAAKGDLFYELSDVRIGRNLAIRKGCVVFNDKPLSPAEEKEIIPVLRSRRILRDYKGPREPKTYWFDDEA